MQRNCRKFKADVAAAQKQQVQDDISSNKRPIQMQQNQPAAYSVTHEDTKTKLKELQQQLDRLKASEDHVLPDGGNAKMYSTQEIVRSMVQRVCGIGCGMIELWLDVGSTHHVVRDKGLLFNRTASNVNSVLVAGGEEHIVECSGHILLETSKGTVTYHGVLCIPKYVVNLLSVPQLDMQGYIVEQGHAKAIVYDLNRNVRLTGSFCDGLYKLNCSTIPSEDIEKRPLGKVHVMKSKVDLLHRHLGHPGMSATRELSQGERRLMAKGTAIMLNFTPYLNIVVNHLNIVSGFQYNVAKCNSIAKCSAQAVRTSLIDHTGGKV
jgi:hypothetical protein